MSSVNKVILIGNLGQDPEIRATQNGARVAQFSLATTEKWKDRSGAKQEKTEWHRCVVWNRGERGLVDVIEQYVKKGHRLYVEGRIEYRQWTDKEGQTRYTTEIKVSELTMLGGPGGERQGGGQGGNGGGGRQAAAQGGSGNTPARAAAARPAPAADPNFPDFPAAGAEDTDDDLPF